MRRGRIIEGDQSSFDQPPIRSFELEWLTIFAACSPNQGNHRRAFSDHAPLIAEFSQFNNSTHRVTDRSGFAERRPFKV
jgi:hypothetical protein